MSEQSGQMPELDEWHTTISLLAANLNLLILNEEAHPEPQTVSGSHSRKHSPSRIASGSSPLNKSSSDSTLSSQSSAQASAPKVAQVSSTFPSHPPLPSTPSSLISSHHQSSSSSSTIHSPAKNPQSAAGYSSNSFEFVPQTHPPLSFQPQFYQCPFETIPQIYHNPVDFARQLSPSKHPLVFLCRDQSTHCTITLETVWASLITVLLQQAPLNPNLFHLTTPTWAGHLTWKGSPTTEILCVLKATRSRIFFSRLPLHLVVSLRCAHLIAMAF